MSLNDHRGSAFYIRELFKAAQAEIDRGERSGARVIHATADDKKTRLRSIWRWPVIAFRKQA